jgi:hypothetical protein
MDRTQGSPHSQPQGQRQEAHNNNAGYVCELRCRLGGHIVIYDRKNGAGDIEADYRWVVMHEPSSLHVAVGSLDHARSIMKGVSRAHTIGQAAELADILLGTTPACNCSSCRMERDQ